MLAQLVQKKGYAQVRAAQSHHDGVAGGGGRRSSPRSPKPGTLRRGVLEVTRRQRLVMQELTFEKERLLAAIQQALPDAGIKQLRFKVGQIG